MTEKTVYLIRHGQTQGNAEKRYEGRRIDEGLSPEGAGQARRLRSALTGMLSGDPHAYRIYASPMRRALETAEILFPDRRIRIIPDLAEIDFGTFEGRNHAELSGSADYQAWIDSGGRAPIPDGEPRTHFISRSWKGFTEALADAGETEGIVVLCHGGSIMAIMSRLTGEDYYAFLTKNLDGYRLKLRMENEGISALAYHRLAVGNPD